jgi:parkin coregulated gene protein
MADDGKGAALPRVATLGASKAPAARHTFQKSGTGTAGTVSKRAAAKPKRAAAASKAPRSGAMQARKPEPSQFRMFYDRGDLHISVEHGASRNKVDWKKDPSKLDYHHYLPVFFDGIREEREPYKFLARQGVSDLLAAGDEEKIIATIPQIVVPLKKALETRNPETVAVALTKIQELVLCGDFIGEALVPYYRQLLPIMNLFKNHSFNLGGVDLGQRTNGNLGELVVETLEMLERTGGEDAYINIKYMIPTYESCVHA